MYKRQDLRALYVGRGYKPYFVEGDDPQVVHQLLAGTLDDCYAEIRSIQKEARKNGFKKQPIWPMIILRTPKGLSLIHIYLGERVFHFDRLHVQTLMYLKLSVAGHLTIFLTRTRGPFWSCLLYTSRCV